MSFVKLYIKYLYQYEVIPQMLKDLQALGITESFIYPGLESLSRDIKRSEAFKFNGEKL